MIRRPPESTLSSSSAASDVYKRQVHIHPGKKRNHQPWVSLAAESLIPSLQVMSPACVKTGNDLNTQGFLGLILAVASATNGSSGQ